MNDTDRRLIAPFSAPHVCLIPAASGLEPGMPDQWNALGVGHFEALGARVSPLKLVARADADDEAILAQLRTADLIYFSGGNPSYLIATLRDSKAWAIIRDRHAAGAVLAGCSAGAMMLGSYTVSIRAMREGEGPRWTPALGIAAGLTVLPHFDRFAAFAAGQLPLLLDDAPDGVTVLGIDEDTALIGDGAGWSVSGRQQVTVFRRGVAAESFANGQRVPLPA